MHFLNLAALRADLEHGVLPPREQLRYMVGVVLIWGAPFSTTMPESWVDHVYWIPSLLIAASGVILCHRMLPEALASQFLMRLIPVAFVMGVRLGIAVLALFLVALFLFFLLAGFLSGVPEKTLELAVSVTTIVAAYLLQAAYWCLVARQLAQASPAA